MGAGATEHKMNFQNKFDLIKTKLNIIQEKYDEMKLNISIFEDINNREKSLDENKKDYKKAKLNYLEKKMDSLIKYMRKINESFESLIKKTNKLLWNKQYIPLIGLGTSRITNIVEVVYSSIKDGLRLIDTATKYNNETEVGEGIQKALKDNLCKREDLFIIGKVCIDDRKDPETAIRNSLKKLNLEYLDLYLDHWPSGDNLIDPKNIKKQISIYEFWPKMEELVKKGLTKSIGCSNYNVQSLLNLLSFCKIKPVANQVEFHPFYYQENLKQFCDKENIALIAYYPLGKGNGARKYIEEHKGEMDIFKQKEVLDLVNKYKKTPGQIILNWIVKQDIIAIPGTSKTDRMKENIESLYFEMDKEDMKSLCKFGKKIKFCGCERFFGYNIMA